MSSAYLNTQWHQEDRLLEQSLIILFSFGLSNALSGWKGHSVLTVCSVLSLFAEAASQGVHCVDALPDAFSPTRGNGPKLLPPSSLPPTVTYSSFCLFSAQALATRCLPSGISPLVTRDCLTKDAGGLGAMENTASLLGQQPQQ